MPKTLNIRVPAGFDNPDTIDALIIPPSVTRGTLGSVLMSVLDASVEKMVSLIDLSAGVIYSRASEGTDMVAALTGAGAGVFAAIEQVEPGRTTNWKSSNAASSKWLLNQTEEGINSLEALLAPTIPRLSAGGVVSVIEDEVEKEGTNIEGDHVFVTVDQTSGQLTVLVANAADVAAVRAVVAAGGAVPCTIRYEQVPAAEAAGAEVVPFES